MINLSVEPKESHPVSQAVSSHPTLLSSKTVCCNDVYNKVEEKLGSIQDIMLDMTNGRVAYAVLSYGGFLNMGNHLFAVPWSALKLDTEGKRFILDVEIDRLKKAPGFDKDHWPDMADSSWSSGIHSYYRAPAKKAARPLSRSEKVPE